MVHTQPTYTIQDGVNNPSLSDYAWFYGNSNFISKDETRYIIDIIYYFNYIPSINLKLNRGIQDKTTIDTHYETAPLQNKIS